MRGSYLDTYFSRVFHRGENVAEVAKNSSERSFEMTLAQSVHTVKDLSVERGLYFSGILLTNKDKEQQKILTLNVANDIPVVVGDIVNWNNCGQLEKWIIFSKEKKVNGGFQTFYIVRCNYLIKWIDKEGHLQQSWCYFVSSMDSKIKDNFRMWNSLVSPQQNKYAEMLLPKAAIERSTSFIVEEEAWYVVEYDWTSVPGIMYISLAEEKINSYYDDVKEGIADTDKLAKYAISLPDAAQRFNVGEEIIPIFTITKNGIPTTLDYTFLPQNKKIAKIVEGKLTAISKGTANIIIQLKDYPFIQKEIEVVVGEEPIFNAYLRGDEIIKLDRQAAYQFVSNQNIDEEVVFTLDDDVLVSIIKTESNQCVLRANAKNKLGKVILTATYKGVEYSKEIKVVPLW